MFTELILSANNKSIRLIVGSKLKLNKQGCSAGLGDVGDAVEVTAIQQSAHIMDSKISVVRLDGQHPNWGNLSGTVISGTGLYLYLGNLLNYFDLQISSAGLYISKDLIFRNRNLINLNCRMLATLPNGDYFVEFEEDIGGCSCDGLGKKGHCIAVSKEILEETPVKGKESTPKKKKKKGG